MGRKKHRKVDVRVNKKKKKERVKAEKSHLKNEP